MASEQLCESILKRLYGAVYQINLEGFCMSGALLIDETLEFYDMSLTDESLGVVHGKVHVRFKEVSKSGCSDISWEDIRNEELQFVYKIESDSIGFPDYQVFSSE